MPSKMSRRGPVFARRALLLSVSLIGTFAVVRLYLHQIPHANFNIGTYNVHHLFTGLLLIVVGGIPLALFSGRNRLLDLATLVFGAGLALSLDEWVYLIVTDGSDSSYLLPVSLWGGLVMIGLAAVYIGFLVVVPRRSDHEGTGI